MDFLLNGIRVGCGQRAFTEAAELAMKKGLPWLSKPYAIETLACAVAQALEGGGQRARRDG